MYGSPTSVLLFSGLMSVAETFSAWSGVSTELHMVSRGEPLSTLYSVQHSSSHVTFSALVKNGHAMQDFPL
eukprot:Skav213027  [mRNA]  locus=scaffold2312:346656:346868:+ [translate_table: standard]